ncbi:SCO family protein [Paracoccus spongiarum]|uniref:SCO family protein n=1 Tax=Paracoccus spongiarum TaxID=3064387 RepID=A0ABT9JB64_9RHOB|nr:SCO family protein [Paracoccus sp. 2205BS29-5]MDP5306980.1 SCO family protein [Paracoccus sp. 2205BS29-5]
MADRKLLFAGTALALIGLVAGGLYLSQSPASDGFAQCRSGAVAGGLEAFGTDFTLTRQDGRRVTADEVFARPSLLYFGYTFCPDVCPLDNARNAEAQALLAERGEDVQMVFITVDPKRDTPETLAEFTAMMSADMVGLTGSEAEIAAVNKGWRNYYKANDAEGDDYYLVDHMTNTYLVLPGSVTAEYYPRNTSPDAMADSVACYLDAAG